MSKTSELNYEKYPPLDEDVSVSMIEKFLKKNTIKECTVPDFPKGSFTYINIKG